MESGGSNRIARNIIADEQRFSTRAREQLMSTSTQDHPGGNLGLLLMVLSPPDAMNQRQARNKNLWIVGDSAFRSFCRKVLYEDDVGKRVAAI